jgi:threonine dehydratase
MDVKEIHDARGRLHGVVHDYIKLERSNYFSTLTGGNIFLKCENRQKTGSFKVRGAYNKVAKLIEDGQRPSAVIAASAGNHAQGVAFAARESGIPAIVVMPKGAPLAKIAATQGYGAEVVLAGESYDDAWTHAKEMQKTTGATFLEPFNDTDVIAGQGTIGLEILHDLSSADVIICPTGGGGLLAGVAAAVKSINPKVKVIGVQAERADAMVRSFKAGSVNPLAKVSTIADGIAVKKPGDITFDLIKKYVDGIVTVSDDEIASTIIELIERTKQVVEPAGATSLAAVVSGKVDARGKNVVCILSGGNIDVGFIHKIIERGLLKRGRQISLAILIPDKPGSLEKISGIIAGTNANVIGVRYDRSSVDMQINDVILHITCECSGREHSARIVKELEASGFKVLV